MMLGKDVILREVGEDSVILDLASQNYYALDPVSTCMVKNLLSTDSFEDALERVAVEYEAPRETIEKDMRELMQVLVDQGLLL